MAKNIEGQLSLFDDDLKPYNDPVLVGEIIDEVAREAEEKYIETNGINQENQYWREISNIVLPRFPTRDYGEKITRGELINLFDKLHGTKYPIGKEYKTMGMPELWDLLKSVKRSVWDNAIEYCPGLAADIERENERIKEDEERRWALGAGRRR